MFTRFYCNNRRFPYYQQISGAVSLTSPGRTIAMNRLNDNQTARVANIAYAMGLTPAEAVALPTTVEISCKKVGMTLNAFLLQLETNKALAAYIAKICRDVTE